MAYTLGQAAKATGKSKAGISQAIATGRITAGKDDIGRWQIEPSELHRVYAPKGQGVTMNAPQSDPNQTAEIAHLKATVEGLERLCRQIEGERDNLRDQNTRLATLLSAPQPSSMRRRWWRF